MKIDNFTLIRNQLTSINFIGKKVKEPKRAHLTGEFEIGNLLEEEDRRFAIKMSIQIVEKGKNSGEELSKVEIEYLSVFDVNEYDVDELINNPDLKEIMPDIINNFVYPDILQYLKITYDNAKIKHKFPEKLTFVEEE